MITRPLPIKRALGWLAILLMALLIFLLGAYSRSENSRPVQHIRELYLGLSGKHEKPARPEQQTKERAEAEAAREFLIRRDQGFQRHHEQIFNALESDSLLRYLYADIDFIPDFNSTYCPGEKLKFFSRFAGHKLTCVRIEYENTEHQTYAVLIHSNVAKGSFAKTLLIYNHGHEGIPGDEEKFAEELFKEALRGGSDILLVSMPFRGLDDINHKIKVKTWDGWAEFNPHELDRSHAVFELFDTGKSHFIRYFVDNAVISAIHFRSKYARINYVGLSGGATTGLYACALLKNILSNCILVAGVMPAKFRLSKKNLGDVEQFSSSLLKNHGVTDLIKEVDASGTRLSLIYNSSDTCCFDNPSIELFREYLASEKVLNINYVVRESSLHGYDPAMILQLLARTGR